MKLSEILADAVYLDLDFIPVVKLPSGEFIAFDSTAPHVRIRTDEGLNWKVTR
jgi:hypothetical protein